MTDAIGGYFELELRKGEHFHKNAIRLNSGRNCFEYILRARGFNRVFMPYYTCQVMYDTAKDVGVEIAYYTVNERLEPINLPVLQKEEAFLYTNYYGLKQNCVNILATRYGNQLIVDNAQAFYAQPIAGIDTFYSPRKFFGVPDGGYLYTDARLEIEIPQAESMQRMTHLLKRIEQGAEAGYVDYQHEEESLDHLPIERMSNLTETLLESIDYNHMVHQRRQNFQILHEQLKESNLMKLSFGEDAVPMVYPYMTGDRGVRKRLIESKVFVATYWPNIDSNSLHEQIFKTNILPLPIDQRYGKEDMKKIVNIIG